MPAAESFTAAISLLAGIGGWLLPVLLKGALVLVMVAIGTKLAQRASAATRHTLLALGSLAALVVCVGAVALPTWSLDFGPRWLALPDPSSASVPAGGAHAGALLGDGFWARPAGADGSHAVGVAVAPALAVVAGLTLLWALGALFLLVRLGLDLHAAARLARNARPLQSGPLASLLTLLVAERRLLRRPGLATGPVATPVTAGLFRPVLVVPEAATLWPAHEQRAVLAHELAHVERRDCLWQAVARVAVALHWPCPLIWWCERRLRAEREMAADDVALGAARLRASDYATFLLTLAATPLPRPPAGALPMAGDSPLGERVERLLETGRRRAPLGRKRLGLAGTTVALSALVLGCLGGTPRAPEEQASATPAVASSEVPGAAALWVAIAKPQGALGEKLLSAHERHKGAAVAAGIAVESEVWWRHPAGLAKEMVTETYLQGPAPGLRTFVAAALSDARVPQERIVFDAVDGGGARTVTVDFATRVVLTGVKATVEKDDLGRPRLNLDLGPASSAIAELTGRPENLARRMVIVAGADQVLAAPVLQSPMTAGRAMITFGPSDTPEAIERLATEINAPALP